MLYESPSLQVNFLPDRIVNMSFNSSDKINKLDKQTISYFIEALDIIEKTDSIQGLVISSSKDSFILGADVFEFASMFKENDIILDSWLKSVTDALTKLEDFPFPTVTALKGFALGGGCELALSTDFRIADPGTKIGLPETKLGIIPGFGGTCRLPRLIGADNAIELIAKAKSLSADEALKVGLIDSIVESNILLNTACATLKLASEGKLDWKRKRQAKLKPLMLNHIEAAMTFSVAKSAVFAIAGKHYPAPLTAISVIESAAKYDRERAIDIERAAFLKIVKTDVTKALVGCFYNDQYIKKLNSSSNLPETFKNIAVIGAGIMGGGIAYQNVSNGMNVLLKDINESAIQKGEDEIARLFSNQVAAGKISAIKMAQTLSKIVSAYDYNNFKTSNIVIEAVVEKESVKAAVLAEIESYVNKDTIITTNTSTISIDSLAKNLKDPTRFCGLHFFNPVYKMPLVEVIRGKNTSDSTIELTRIYAKAIGKTAIVVNDCPGFFVNRILFPYFFAFVHLVKDGIDFSFIDRAMERDFGWPMGPGYLIDVVGLDTCVHASKVMETGYPSRMTIKNNVIESIFKMERLGQKNGLGFYKYTKDQKNRLQKELDPVVLSFLNDNFKPQEMESKDIIARMMIPMAIEAVRCLEEGIIASPAEADTATLYGLGFPPFVGGIFRYLDNIGIANFVALADKFAYLGELYQVTDNMRNLAKDNKTYYEGDLL